MSIFIGWAFCGAGIVIMLWGGGKLLEASESSSVLSLALGLAAAIIGFASITHGLQVLV